MVLLRGIHIHTLRRRQLHVLVGGPHLEEAASNTPTKAHVLVGGPHLEVAAASNTPTKAHVLVGGPHLEVAAASNTPTKAHVSVEGDTAHHPTWSALGVEGWQKPAHHVLHQASCMPSRQNCGDQFVALSAAHPRYGRTIQ